MLFLYFVITIVLVSNMGITDIILPGRAVEPGTDGALIHQQSLTPTDEPPNAVELFANSTSLTDLIEKLNNQQNYNQRVVPSTQTQAVNIKSNGNNRMDGVQPLIVGQPVIAGSLTGVSNKTSPSIIGRTRPKLHREDSLELFAKIATTTDDALSQITPTLGFATPEPVAGLADAREQLTALSGVQHDHHSLHASSTNEATDSLMDDGIISSSLPPTTVTPDANSACLPFSSFSQNDLITNNSLSDGQPPPLLKLEPGLNEGSLLGDDDWMNDDDKSLLAGTLTPDIWPAPLNGGSLPSFTQTYIKKVSNLSCT